MILIVTEKPSAARNFAKALNGMKGNYSGVDYTIFSLRGHVLELLDPHLQVVPELANTYQSWDIDLLPWQINDFAFKKDVMSGCEDIIDDLSGAIKDVEEVVIATDDDPSGEGELLAWEALAWVGWSGYTTRMYFVDEAPKSIQKAFLERKVIPSMHEDGDYLKALTRQRWDFCSMQFVRIASSLAKRYGFNPTVRQGRLKSVMVKFVGDQLKAYNEYVKTPFYEARFKDQNGNVFRRIVDDESDIRFDSADKVDISVLHDSDISEDSRTLKHTSPGKLLDLAGMSAILAKQGFKPDDVLATYQKMYENQVVSYPRTEDKEITPEQFDELLPLSNKIAAVINVDTALLTHKTPRKSHVKEGGAHGANRPGINIPKNLESLSKYGKEGPAIYELLAKNYLAMLCEDYEYELVKGHVKDFPEYVGETKIPVSLGFKAVFDVETSSYEPAESEEKDNSREFSSPAKPYVHEGSNKRPQKPTMKWLNKRLEKFNVGTGATRTSTLAEITKGDEKALLNENKGALTLTDCGQVSYALLEGCQIANPQTTEGLFEAMERVGDFKEDPIKVLDTCTLMVIHDREAMIKNAPKLESLNLVTRKTAGVCPVCGKKLLYKGKIITCESNKEKRNEDGEYEHIAGCGFKMFNPPKFRGKTLTSKQTEKLLDEKSGHRVLLKGLKSQSSNKTYEAFVKLLDKPFENGFYGLQMDGFANSKRGKAGLNKKNSSKKSTISAKPRRFK